MQARGFGKVVPLDGAAVPGMGEGADHPPTRPGWTVGLKLGERPFRRDGSRIWTSVSPARGADA
jgi:hypothetical protein